MRRSRLSSLPAGLRYSNRALRRGKSAINPKATRSRKVLVVGWSASPRARAGRRESISARCALGAAARLPARLKRLATALAAREFRRVQQKKRAGSLKNRRLIFAHADSGGGGGFLLLMAAAAAARHGGFGQTYLPSPRRCLRRALLAESISGAIGPECDAAERDHIAFSGWSRSLARSSHSRTAHASAHFSYLPGP